MQQISQAYKSITNKLLFVGLLSLALVLLAPAITPKKAKALSGTQFQAGRIIDDAIFYNSNAMSVAQIQQFLNSKLPSCDTNGSKSHSYHYRASPLRLNHPSDPWVTTTRAVYGERVYQRDGAWQGSRAPYKCLKDYAQTTGNITPESGLCNGYSGASNETAATIIHKVSQSCGINPQVLLVLLQKEQSLITDDWPWGLQYTKATGAFCPDNPPAEWAPINCNPSYTGFFKQMYYGAHRFKVYKANPDSFNYKAGRNNTILWHPNTACGTSSVFIQNQATAALYIYTPYRPNAAALNNLYGTGDACSSYGNRNFWRMFNDWFGSPINDVYFWEVIHETSTGKLYLVVNNKRHWIPNPTILATWGLDDEPYRDVNTTYVNQLLSGATLQSVALDANGTRYLMSQGKRYRLKSNGYVLAWGVAGMAHISAPGLVAMTPSGGDAGRFAKLPDGTTYLMNGYSKHLPLNSESFSHWGVSASATTNVVASDIAHLPVGSAVGQYIVFNGSRRIVDRGSELIFKNSNTAHAWSSMSFVTAHSYASNLLPKKTIGSFVQPVSSPHVYFVEGGKSHYVPSGNHAAIWGNNSGNPLTSISDTLFSDLTPSTPLGHVVASSDGKVYLISKSKYHLPSAHHPSIYSGTGTTIPSFTKESLAHLPTGSAISSPIVKFTSDSKVYILDDGKLRHIVNPTALDAFGGNRNNKINILSDNLKPLLGTDTAVDYKVTDGTTVLYLENGYRYPINDSFLGTWKATGATQVSDELLKELEPGGKVLGAGIQHAGKKYLVSDGSLLDVSSTYQNFGLSSSSFTNLTRLYFSASKSGDSIFIQAINGSKVYVLSNGKIYHVKNSQTLSDLGFGSYFGIVRLHTDLLNNLLTEQPGGASRLIKTASGGVLFASAGRGYTFPNLSTLKEYKGSQDYMVISPQHFNRFSVVGGASKLITGTNGKVYAVDDGLKRWVTSQSTLNNLYPNEKILKLPQATIDGFSTGPNL